MESKEEEKRTEEGREETRIRSNKEKKQQRGEATRRKVAFEIDETREGLRRNRKE